MLTTYKDRNDILSQANIFFDNSPDKNNYMEELKTFTNAINNGYDGVRICKTNKIKQFSVCGGEDYNAKKKYVQSSYYTTYDASKIKKITIKLKNGSLFIPHSYKIYVRDLLVDLSRYNNIIHKFYFSTIKIRIDIPNHIHQENIDEIIIDKYEYMLGDKHRPLFYEVTEDSIVQDITIHNVK